MQLCKQKVKWSIQVNHLSLKIIAASPASFVTSY